MNCMKCGREIDDSQAFCDKCLAVMDQCPVKPEVVIQLPTHPEEQPKWTAPRKKVRTPEEQILRLKRHNRWLALTACLLLLISMFLAYLSIDFFRQLDVQKFLGQNYSTAETSK